jgi:hypothetical protein
MTIIARLEPVDPNQPPGGVLQIGDRPPSIDGCMQTWAETYESQTIRTNMEAPGYIKVRRRVTGQSTKIEASVTMAAKLYDDLLLWFFEKSLAGTVPTRVKRPQDGKEIVVRFAEPPNIEFIDKGAFVASFKFEQLPIWRYL